MSYVVTLENDYKKDHLRAVADDGINGLANCQFPKSWNGISREDFSNEGTQFEVSRLNWNGRCYRVNAADIIRVINSEEAEEIEKSKEASSSSTTNSSVSNNSKDSEFIQEVPDSGEDEPFYFTLDMFEESFHYGESREQLISQLEKLGYHYKWNKYSDEQLFRMLDVKEKKHEEDKANYEYEKELQKQKAAPNPSYFVADTNDLDNYDWVCEYYGNDIYYKKSTDSFIIDGSPIEYPTEGEAIEAIKDSTKES